MKLSNISKSYDNKKIIDSLSLELPKNGTVAVMGPSGYGKTTLLRIIAGLEKAHSGNITDKGERVSYAFQEPRLFPWLSALDNVVLSCDDRDKALEWLSLVELGSDAAKLPHELSGGMEQRVSLARALAYDADLYILDEPFTGLDEGLKSRLYSLVKERAKKALVLIVTHDRNEAEALADEIITFESSPLSQYTKTKNRE